MLISSPDLKNKQSKMYQLGNFRGKTEKHLRPKGLEESTIRNYFHQSLVQI